MLQTICFINILVAKLNVTLFIQTPAFPVIKLEIVLNDGCEIKITSKGLILLDGFSLVSSFFKII